MTDAPAYLANVSLAGLERIAREVLDDSAFAYFSAGARDEQTQRANRDAWRTWALVPSVLVGAEPVSLATTLLGTEVANPFAIAPMAAQRWAHPDGEIATARAAASVGSLMIVSTSTTVAIEDIVAASEAVIWFQLYALKDRGRTREMVARASAAGARAIALTVDSVVEESPHRRPVGDLTFPSWLDFPMRHGETAIEDHLDWSYVEELRSEIDLPLVLKGILHPEDARRAVASGCQGIVVSNHGGRQLDGAIPTADILSEVADAVGDRAEVYVDGGVRRGVDALRARALGARAVLVGRPALWGLAAAGEPGVRRVLDILIAELQQDARQSGVTDLDSVSSTLLRKIDPGLLGTPDPVRGR